MTLKVYVNSLLHRIQFVIPRFCNTLSIKLNGLHITNAGIKKHNRHFFNFFQILFDYFYPN